MERFGLFCLYSSYNERTALRQKFLSFFIRDLRILVDHPRTCGPLLVMVVSPINGRKYMGNWGYFTPINRVITLVLGGSSRLDSVGRITPISKPFI